MKKTAAILILLLIIAALPAAAQETVFGKNKVQYRIFNWEYIQTDHFDIYFYDNAYDLAKFTAREMENAYMTVTDQLHYFVGRRVPVFIYNSQNDFQQTNITWGILSEGTEGFTEAFKNRIVLHFFGSYAEYRHLVHHELTHAVIYDMLYGQFFKSLLSSRRLFSLPMWFAEGYAEYSSNGGWTVNADMMVRDATVNDYLRPPDYMGFLSYTEGFALVKYIADNYGVDKLGEILKRGKALATMDKALKSAIGMDSEELFDKFSKDMKKRYWPDISVRDEPEDFAKKLTDHTKDGSHYNEKPVFSPTGRTIAMFSDRTGYSEIFLISAINGKVLARLVKGERNAALESLRWYTSGMSFSPDGNNLVFVSKANGEDALNFFKIDGKDIYLRKKFGLKSIISPAWSPDGKNVAFSALASAERNLYLYNIESEKLVKLTDDRFDEIDVAWYPDSRRIIFSTDRPHPDDYVVIDTNEFVYGNYNLQELDTQNGRITPVRVGPGQNTEPVVSADGEKIAFVSDRNGIQNIYVYYIDSARVQAVTNALTDAKSPTWSPDGKMIAFSTFYKAGYDLFLIKDIEAKGDNGVLEPTDFILGKYDKEGEWARGGGEAEGIMGSDGTTLVDDIPREDPDFPTASAAGRHRWGHLTETEKQKPAEDTTQAATPAEDSTATSGVSDTTQVSDTTTAHKPPEEDVYVYNAPKDSAFEEIGDLSTETDEGRVAFRESVDSLSADSLNNILPDGEYRVRPYKTKFTPDIIAGGLQYDSFFGFQGQSVFIFSDYLGDHQIMIATDLVNTIDQSNLQFYYFYNKLRVDFHVGLFHTKNYYIDARNDLFSDRFYGFLAGMSWPRSTFTRFEFNAATFFVDRKYYDAPDLSNRDVRLANATLSWIHDTVLWGITGPINGRRYRINLEAATPVFGSRSLDYYAAEFDFRHYIRLGRPFSLAIKTAGGFSDGGHPKTYYLGGSTNKIGTISVGNDVYNVENLYFSGVVTPLRGYDYYELPGSRYAVTNFELHFPFIDYFVMRYPLHMGLSQIAGALFFDIGAAWDDNTLFKGATSKGGTRLVGIKSGYGFGARANLGFLVLRYDMAWRTDLKSVAPHTHHYFSLGADF